MTFENGNSYDLSDPDLQYFILNTQFDKPINNRGPIYTFLNDMKYDLNYGDKKSLRYQLIKELYILAINYRHMICRASSKGLHIHKALWTTHKETS